MTNHNPATAATTDEETKPRFSVSYSTTAARGHGGYQVHCVTREQADAEFATAVGLVRGFEVVEVESLGVGVLRRVHLVHPRTRRVWHVVQMSELLSAEEFMVRVKASPSYNARLGN